MPKRGRKVQKQPLKIERICADCKNPQMVNLYNGDYRCTKCEWQNQITDEHPICVDCPSCSKRILIRLSLEPISVSLIKTEE